MVVAVGTYGSRKAKIQYAGGGVAVESLTVAARAVVCDGAKILGKNNRPAPPQKVIVCARAREKMNLKRDLPRAGITLTVVDPGQDVDTYVLPKGTHERPTIHKGLCCNIGGCSSEDRRFSPCQGCSNKELSEDANRR